MLKNQIGGIVVIPYFVAISVLTIFVGEAAGQTRLERVLSDQVSITEEGFWLYNDLKTGKEAARRTGQPILVTFRCIPCEECVKLDEELIEADPEVKQLLDKFVRVRVVSTNGLDLETFQFDFDQSFNVMMMNADGTLYGRYGTRSDRTEWEGDVSIRGLAKALERTLDIHESYPNNRADLLGKQPIDSLFSTPNEAPLHRNKFPLDLEFDDQVVKNCIHCHMVGDAERDFFWKQRKPIPDRYVFQYPHPKSLGLIVDPKTCGEVVEVVEDSPASQLQLEPGDQIISIDGQPIISIADIQWVFHNSEDGDVLKFEFERKGETRTAELKLPTDFRRLDRIDWRVTSWPLRRMVTGGAVMRMASTEEREELRIDDDDQMALVVTRVGEYGPHRTAKRRGIREGDVIVKYDGQTDLLRETDLLVHGVQELKIGAEVEIEIVREGNKRITVKLPIQP